MRLRAEQLQNRLQNGALSPLYLFSGDEPLQSIELADAVRGAARRAGIEERIVLEVERGFDWNSLQTEANSMSLFATRRLIELRLGSASPGKEGGQCLRNYAQRPAPDDVLLITAAKFDRRVQQSQWFKAIEQIGVVVQLWPIELKALPDWLQRRTAARGTRMSKDAAELIAERVEGNLLAAAQEVERLLLLHPGEEIESDTVLASVDDSARYDIFTLADAALAGDAVRTLRVLHGLREVGVDATSVSWVLMREIRLLAVIHDALAAGQDEARVFAEQRIWDKRKPLVRGALKRLRYADYGNLLRAAARIDRVVKGIIRRDPWAELTWLCLALSNQRFDRIQAALLR